jgi:hypothetical protein
MQLWLIEDYKFLLPSFEYRRKIIEKTIIYKEAQTKLVEEDVPGDVKAKLILP